MMEAAQRDQIGGLRLSAVCPVTHVMCIDVERMGAANERMTRSHCPPSRCGDQCESAVVSCVEVAGQLGELGFDFDE